MAKTRVGHKENSFLNRGWGVHAGDSWIKRFTSKRRRGADKKVIKNDLKDEL